MLKIQVILSSIRPNRTGETVAKWFMDQVAEKYPDVEFTLQDLKEWNFPPFAEEVSATYANKKYPLEIVQKWSEVIDSSDGFIFITPEYNHGYPGFLKDALDYLQPEWHNKPAAFVSYGGLAGGSRSVEQLRQVAIELWMAPIRNSVLIPLVWEAFDENGNIKNEKLNDQVSGLIEQLLWWTKALKAARDQSSN